MCYCVINSVDISFKKKKVIILLCQYFVSRDYQSNLKPELSGSAVQVNSSVELGSAGKMKRLLQMVEQEK